MPVESRHPQAEDMAPRWRRARDTYDGADAVKDAGDAYLPMLGSHKRDSDGRQEYAAYKLRALLYNAMGRTVEGLIGMVSQKPPTLVAPRAEPHLNDVTLGGVDAATFITATLREELITGRAGVLVDMAGGELRRPYWSRYRAEDIWNWSTTRIDGDEIVTRVVLREVAREPDPTDSWQDKSIEQFRVLELLDGTYTQTIYRHDPDVRAFVAGPAIVPLRRGDPLRAIPFVFSPRISKPPLLDLADVNLSHYRNSADYEHGLHWTALPTPWVSGKTGDSPLPIGSSVAWELSEGGKAGMLEFSGAGLKSIAESMASKERLMATLGARLLEQQPNRSETATAVMLRHAGEDATLRSVVEALDRTFKRVLQWHGWWALGGTEERPEDIEAEVALNKDFVTIAASPEEIKTAMFLWQSGSVTFETFYHLLQRGEWARPGVSAKEEMAQILREGVVRGGVDQ